jgi:AdoMet-dependent heme synthase
MVHGMTEEANLIKPGLQLVAWELTRSCNLRCAHCRASSSGEAYSGELSTDECLRLVDGIAEAGKPILILTGGEPLMRKDLFSIGSYAAAKQLRVVMGSNGTLITPETAARLKEIPVSRIAVSLDFPSAELQDKFRGQPGAYDAAVAGINNARRAGIEVQINCTITQLNIGYLDALLSLALELGAVAFHPFLLVPTGRGKGLENVALSAQQHEDTLNRIYDMQMNLGDRIFFKPTDAPHYLRIMKQRGRGSEVRPASTSRPGNPAHSISRGCLAGTGFCFISHRGAVQGCGYLDVEAGNVREQPFKTIWQDSSLFRDLRDLRNLKGKCGLCEYKKICGGCRARAYETTGDYLEAEPCCIYQPSQREDHVNA